MTQLALPVDESDHRLGEASARLELVEYGDFQCPFCRRAYVELKVARRALGNGISLVYRQFPLVNLHQHALRAAMFSEAAATIGKFWEMHDALFENQTALRDQDLIRYAERLGFDDALIAATMKGRFMQKIQRDIESGLNSGVNGTPTLFVNGHRYEGRLEAPAITGSLEVR